MLVKKSETGMTEEKSGTKTKKILARQQVRQQLYVRQPSRGIKASLEE